MHAIEDTVKLFPFLFITYVLLEIIGHNAMRGLDVKQLKSRYAPVIGAGLGVIPQCGFSVMATKLYNMRYITVGALMAIYISSSDEAIPIMLSNPDSIPRILPLIGTKLVFAIIVGVIVDLIINRKKTSIKIDNNASKGNKDSSHNNLSCNKQLKIKENDNNIDISAISTCCNDLNHNDIKNIPVCPVCDNKKQDKSSNNNVRKYLLSPLKHSLIILLYIFIINIILGTIVHSLGEEKLNALLISNSIFQPVFTALFGLIPNCASSVVITQLYIKDSITFGSAIAGLCVNSGVAYAVLFKQKNRLKENLLIISTIFILSSLLGMGIVFYNQLIV